MIKKIYFLPIILFSFITHAQTTPPIDEIASLKNKIIELEEIQRENSELIKRQLSDQHFDQNSRGYIEIKYGISSLSPDDIEEMNDETFRDINGSNWEEFGSAKIFELEIGKTILHNDFIKHEIGIGYQNLRSSIEAGYTPTSGGRVAVTETISMNTLFARYSLLFKINNTDDKLFVGPGATLGYSPDSKITIDIEQGNEGVHVLGEGTSALFEIFGKAKYEVSRYFSLVGNVGYRLQNANDIRVNVADIVTLKTKEDLDASGVFAVLGFAASF